MSKIIGSQSQKIGDNEGVFSVNELVALDNNGLYNTQPITATGGTTFTYTDPKSTVTFNCHAFNSSGTFQITAGRGTIC